jgi:hypothetical protein
MVAAMTVKSSVCMKNQNEASTISSMQEELRCLLTHADNLLRLFNINAQSTLAEGASKIRTVSVGGQVEGFR